MRSNSQWSKRGARIKESWFTKYRARGYFVRGSKTHLYPIPLSA